MAINSAVISGRLTRDPELRQTPSGVSVCNFTVAVDKYSKSGEDKQANFIDCVAWRGTADFVSKYFSKGRKITVAGSIETRNYEDKNGNKRTAVEILAENVDFADSKSSDGNGDKNGHGYANSSKNAIDDGITDILDDEPPF